MIDSAISIACLSTFLIGVTTYAASQSLLLLAICNAVCVVSGLLLGRVTPDLPFSTGAPFFSVALFGIALKHRVYGTEEASRALRNILFALLVVFGSLFLLDRVFLLGPMFDACVRRAGARIICLSLVQSLLIFLLDKRSELPTLLRLPAIVIVAETFEGLFFYPCILIGERLPGSMLEFTAKSIGIRIMTTLLAIPCLGVFLYIERNGWTPNTRSRTQPVVN